MAVAFYIPSVDEEEPVKPNHPQQVGQQQHQQQSSNQTTSSDLSQQVCAEAEAVAELQRHHLMVVFHEILVAYAREGKFLSMVIYWGEEALEIVRCIFSVQSVGFTSD